MENTNTIYLYKALHRLSPEAKSHDIPVDYLLKLLNSQEGRCAICRRPLMDLSLAGAPTEIEIGAYAPAWGMTKPHADFCPNTGRIRGLTCKGCLRLVHGETNLFSLPQVKRHNPRSQARFERLAKYFGANRAGPGFVSSQWEPNPMLRA